MLYTAFMIAMVMVSRKISSTFFNSLMHYNIDVGTAFRERAPVKETLYALVVTWLFGAIMTFFYKLKSGGKPK